MQKTNETENMFPQLKGDNLPTIIESLCTSCLESGQTRILLTKIPFFRQIIVTSFYCDKCGNKNTEIQFAGKLPDYGIQILFKVLKKQDINREIIISEHAKIWLEELELEMPKVKKAEITTIEGLLTGVEEDLKQLQQQRKVSQPERYEQVEVFLNKLREYSRGQKFPLSIRIKDPSGNSFIKNPYAPKIDKNLQVSSIPRSLDDLVNMGYNVENAQEQIKQLEGKKMGNKINFTKPFEQSQFMRYEPVLFDVPCHSCQMPGQMKMCQTSIPYFTDMIIMSFACDYCGAHSTETKNTGIIKDEGCVITLKADSQIQLKRDLFKSQTCKVQIPQIQLELDYGTLGGVFTTVEGLIEKIEDHLGEQNPFADSDSAFHNRMQSLLKDLSQLRQNKKSFTLIMRDPLGHSFLQNPNHPNQDTKATRYMYKRSQQQNDTLGITDMKTQGYEKDKSDTKSQGSMKKSKDRKYSEGSVESIQDMKKSQQNIEQNKNETIYPVKFTKQSPHKATEQPPKKQ